MLGFDNGQYRRCIPQQLLGEVQDWYLAQPTNSSDCDWASFQATFCLRYPQQRHQTNSILILQQLKDRKQHTTEPFLNYYNDIMKLCKEYDAQISDSQCLDHLKIGMKVTLLEKVISNDIKQPQELLIQVQQIELNQKIIDLRMSEGETTSPSVLVSQHQQQSSYQRPYPQQDYSYNQNYSPPRQQRPQYYFSPKRLSYNDYYPQQLNYSLVSYNRTQHQQPYSPTPSTNSIRCFRCSGYGHYSSECPTQKNFQ
ncbi:unnamed protein product [Didymodactylos carnosus]|uniref:CCHC-type domain-containing protein n=1 Tax=Didymodactylos carnosus TaxID=1234261 RepID=A0A815HFA6_9BILA|nr:unnamed protein product [Didymodactylos carnosus]CAF4222208.1 unnamed protein product [Didymodactylos carnosus]